MTSPEGKTTFLPSWKKLNPQLGRTVTESSGHTYDSIAIKEPTKQMPTPQTGVAKMKGSRRDPRALSSESLVQRSSKLITAKPQRNFTSESASGFETVDTSQIRKLRIAMIILAAVTLVAVLIAVAVVLVIMWKRTEDNAEKLESSADVLWDINFDGILGAELIINIEHFVEPTNASA